MFLSNSYTYTHTISGNDIWIEEQAIKAALVKGGYDPANLSFDGVAAQSKVREIATDTAKANIPLHEVYWAKPDHNGDVEVSLSVPSDLDLVRMTFLLSGL